ncbi:hypothetical protein NLU13_8503 [Sarocladium strictum]|uniref:Arrestin-like N-terminal domain-containing protein n=1 Tax=Sarocladium strictum TaxID=5046 RepID=A0AA39GCB1_SARSR|nr:hypothetical protein NLU13_8503 [Sarocladium strictum]
MPRSTVQASPQLEIQLEDDRFAWTGGDAIIGRVSRCAPVVSHQATISVTLLGRAKSKMTVSRGQAGTSIYRGRFNFFPPEQSKVELLNGPIHIPETGDIHCWPFSLKVPSQLDPATVSDRNQQKFSFLPLGDNEIRAQTMPPSFYTRGVWFNTTYEAYIEYFLQAELTTQSGGSIKTEIATLPINVLARSTPRQALEPYPMRFASLCHLNSYRLLPGAENASLSLQQRTQHLFRSSKVPQYSFTLQVDCPRLLQIGNPAPVPFKILAIREPSHTTDVLQDRNLELAITSIQLEVRSTTEILCRGTITSHNVKGTRKVCLLGDTAIADHGVPILVPSSDKSEAIDVGKALGLTLEHVGPDLRVETSSKLTHALFPTFNTYNIQHHHKLIWKLGIGSAGETTKISSEVDLTLLSLLPTSDAPPYTPFASLEERVQEDVPLHDPSQLEEAVPTYAEAVPFSSKSNDFVSKKAQLKE